MKNHIVIKMLLVIHLIFLIGIMLTGCEEAISPDNGEQRQEDSIQDKTKTIKTSEENRDLNIAWYATVPHPFFQDVRVGVEAFEKEYGIDVEKQIGPDWKQTSQTENIEALAAKGYKLFSIYPTDPSGANALYDEMARKGCKIVNFGANTVEPTKADFYVGTDVKAAAMTACEELIKTMGGKGNIINVLEILGDSNTALRKQGIEEVVKKYPKVRIIQEIAGINNVEEAVHKINDTISVNINVVDGIIASGDTTSIGVAQVLSEYKKSGGKRTIHAIGINTDPIVVKAIKEGIMDETIAQNPYGMGYLSCLLLKYIQEGWESKTGKYTRIDAGTIIAKKDNIDNIDTELIKMTYEIKQSLESKYLKK